MTVRLDVAGCDVGNRLLAKRHWRFRSWKNERANELESRIVVARTNELIPASGTPFVRELLERHGCGLLWLWLPDTPAAPPGTRRRGSPYAAAPPPLRPRPSSASCPRDVQAKTFRSPSLRPT